MSTNSLCNQSVNNEFRSFIYADQSEAQKLDALRVFATEPTQSKYCSLDISSRYLVAGRYTYPVTMLWTITSRFELMKKLERDFQSTVDAPRLAKAAQEAVDLQEKILFAKILLSTLERRENIEPLASLKPHIFKEIKECLWKAYDSPLDQGFDFAGDVLRANTDDHKIKETIKTVIFLWDSAHCDISFCKFKVN